MLFITLLALAALPPSLSVTGESALVWDTSEISSEIHYGELHSIEVPGFSSCQSGVLLPEKRVMIPVPVTGDVSLRVVPSGVRSLGPPPPMAMSGFEEGREVFTEASPSSIPTDWGGIAERGTFRRAGYVSVRLNPVILSGGELLAADGLRIELDHSPLSSPARVRGHEGEIFRAVFGTDEVWREPAGRALDSPFWGKPWARIQVDTAGVYAVTGDMIPEAVGMPSGSFQ